MAQLLIETDPVRAGIWMLRSDNPAVLAAVPDAIVQVLDLGGETLSVWALHPDEQAGIRDAAYHDELQEIGHGPSAQVMELARPWQQNVVWVDRYHLLVTSAPPAIGSRLLGLYVGSAGRIVLSVHHPSVTALVAPEISALPEDGGRAWERDQLIANSRFVVRSDPDHPGAVQVRAPQPMTAQVQDALSRLALTVAAW